MRLLIFTQVVDSEDHFLGFFHRWIEEISKHFESVIVICLKKGKYNLPSNVRVLSLGKENGESRIKYIKNFYKYIWSERKNYDKVFVHMNQEYVLLGAIFWILFNKEVFMWRNHYSGSFLTDIAAYLCKKVFCTSKYSYTAKYKHTEIMPVGVDTDLFYPERKVQRKANSILSFGRISPSKNIHVLLNAFSILKKKGIPFNADIYGDALPKDITYLQSLYKKTEELSLSDEVRFYSGIEHSQAPELFYSHEIFLNPSKSGMYDKMIFEAMICDSLLLSSNEDLKENIDNNLVFKYNDPQDIADKIAMVLALPAERKVVISGDLKRFGQGHSLDILAKKLSSSII